MPSQHKTPHLENSIKNEAKYKTSNEISSLEEFCKKEWPIKREFKGIRKICRTWTSHTYILVQDP